MRAGFAGREISPPLGTLMAGWWHRDTDHGCDAILDPPRVCAAFFEQDGEAALIIGYDLLFLGRENCDRIKGALGRRLDLSARRILLNTSHSHASPADGSYGIALLRPQDTVYQRRLVDATVAAAVDAVARAEEVSLSAGVTDSQLPICRRCPTPDGFINAPAPERPCYTRLPVILARNSAGRPVVCLFSVSTHPTILPGWGVSAEYPGVARQRVNEHLGADCALFLQGVGGDSKPRVSSAGDRWLTGDWSLVEDAGGMLGDEVIALLDAGLEPIQPRVRAACREVHWPLRPAWSREEYAAKVSDDPEVVAANLQQLSFQHQIERLDRGETLPDRVPLTVQGLQLGEGLRLTAVEGEACSPFGPQMEQAFGHGLTVPLGYSNGTGLYLVTGEQLAEGGYEPSSWWEYFWPAPPDGGFEGPLERGLLALRSAAIG